MMAPVIGGGSRLPPGGSIVKYTARAVSPTAKRVVFDKEERHGLDKLLARMGLSAFAAF